MSLRELLDEFEKFVAHHEANSNGCSEVRRIRVLLASAFKEGVEEVQL